MYLYIAEKPSMALEIAKCLGKYDEKKGFYQVGEDCVTWLYGHILEMYQPEDYQSKFKDWRAEDLPIMPSVWKNRVSFKYKKQFEIVKDLLKKAAEIIHAGDPDREGQILVDEVLTFVGNQKPVKRILLNALDEKSIQAALKDLQKNEDFAGLRMSAEMRQRTDWLVGMNYSRAFSLAARKKGHRGVFPVGRVKTPTMAIVVRREDEIQNFKPIKYYGIIGLFKTIRDTTQKEESLQMNWRPKEDTKGLDTEGRLVDVISMRDILERLNGGNRQGKVTKYEIQPKVEKPKKPFSLSTLQIAAGQVYGYEPKEVLDICQSLYEKKLTTYPRSDCEFLPINQWTDGANILHNLKLTGNEELAAFAKAADAALKSPAWNDNKITAHHALIPTSEICNLETLKEEERNIYFLIARAYIVQFLPDHRYNQTKIEVVCADEVFTASGKTVTSEIDWKIVYRKEQKEQAADEQEERILPALNDGEIINLMRATNQEKTTNPPKRFTPATLIQAMKEIHKFVLNDDLKSTLKDVTGIGTEATRAGIIDELIEKGFLLREKKNVIPSQKAIQLVSMLPVGLTYPDFTAVMENNLEKVVEGIIKPDQVMQAQIEEVVKMCQVAEKLNLPIADQAIVCPECGDGVLNKRKGKNGDFWGCTCYPSCKASFNDSYGSPHLMPRPAGETGISCPVCGHGKLTFNKKFSFWGCSEYKEGCRATFSDDGTGQPMMKKCTCGEYLRKFTGEKGCFWSCTSKRCKNTYTDKNGKPIIE